MALVKYIEIFGQLDYLVKTKTTGTPKQLADQLKISERMLYVYLADMKKVGALIRYDRKSKTYQYTSDFNLQTAIDSLVKKILVR